MLFSKSLLFVCIGFGCLSAQSYFHTNHGNAGSYTSITHGSASPAQHAPQPATSYAQPARPSYAQPASTYAHAVNTQVYKTSPVVPAHHHHQPSYQPAQAYHQPAAYQKPAPAYHSAPAYPVPHSQHPPTYGEKCAVDYKEEYLEVCVPTLEKSCVPERIGNGVRISQEYDCYPVTRTVCTEYEDIELTEVCAVSYSLEQVPATSKLVDVKWEKDCKEEIFCSNPHSQGAYHAAAYCKEQVKITCSLYPVLYPVEQTVVLKLPQPYDTCITKEIILPRVKCQQVREKRCASVPKTVEAAEVDIEKCTVSLAAEQCSQTAIKLPRQGCLETFKQVKLVYEEQEAKTNYSRY